MDAEQIAELNYGDEAALNILMLSENGFAEVIDFSERGAMCRIYTSRAVQEFERHGVDLFNCVAGQYLKGLRCKLAYCMKAPGRRGKKLYQLEFSNLSEHQRKQLNQFIEDGYQYFAESEAHSH